VFALGADGKRMLEEDSLLSATIQIPFVCWLSALWYEAVGTGDVRHYRAGTNLSQVKSVAGVRFYVSKYMGKECDGKSEWACGRWWGVRKKGNIPWVKLLGSTVNLFTGDSAQWWRLAEWLARGPS
jgi:hypothetical protein